MTGVDANFLLAQAQRCRRLARDTTDPQARQALLEMAAEYTTKAEQLRAASQMPPKDPAPATG